MATSRVKQPNAPLRFYADMVSLRARLQPAFANDDFGRLAIWPMFLIVNEWVYENQSHRRRVTPGEIMKN
jgi:hypothetical protein